MAWINKTTFDIVQELQDCGQMENHFFVDDMIAHPVALLNKKGYETIESCAGHPFANEHSLTTEIGLLQRIDFDDIGKPQKNVETAKVQIRTFARRMAYIDFKEPLPEDVGVPEGWMYESEDYTLLTHFTKKLDPYTFFESQLRRMKDLMNWINTLPNK